MTDDEIPPTPETAAPQTADAIAFVKGLIERGEAVEPRPDGSLPPDATHAIVGRTGEGHPIVKRVRFRIA